MVINPIRQPVHNRGTPPQAFLDELVAWGKTAPEEIFAYNRGADIYYNVTPELGAYLIPHYRPAVMLEVLRVLAGFESSWDWAAGRDLSASNTDPETAEAGAWQVSYNSRNFGVDLRTLIINNKICTGEDFQRVMKSNHTFAMEYTARLLRHTVNHHGPVKRKEINPWLRRDAVEQFALLLGGPSAPKPDVRAQVKALADKFVADVTALLPT